LGLLLKILFVMDSTKTGIIVCSLISGIVGELIL